MANHDKRLDRQTGNYKTIEGLTEAVLALDRAKKHSRKTMGEMTGVSGATVTRIIQANKPVEEVKVDLNKMINELWRIT